MDPSKITSYMITRSRKKTSSLSPNSEVIPEIILASTMATHTEPKITNEQLNESLQSVLSVVTKKI